MFLADLNADAELFRKNDRGFIESGIDARLRDLKVTAELWQGRGVGKDAIERALKPLSLDKKNNRLKEIFAEQRKNPYITSEQRNRSNDLTVETLLLYGELRDKLLPEAYMLLGKVVSDHQVADREKRRKADLALAEGPRAFALGLHLSVGGDIVSKKVVDSIVRLEQEVKVAFEMPPLDVTANSTYVLKYEAYRKREELIEATEKSIDARKSESEDVSWKLRALLKSEEEKAKPVTATEGVYRVFVQLEAESKKAASDQLAKSLLAKRNGEIQQAKIDLHDEIDSILTTNAERLALEKGISGQQEFDRIAAIFKRMENALKATGNDAGRKAYATAFTEATKEKIIRESRWQAQWFADGIARDVAFSDIFGPGVTIAGSGKDIVITVSRDAYLLQEKGKEQAAEMVKDLQVTISGGVEKIQHFSLLEKGEGGLLHAETSMINKRGSALFLYIVNRDWLKTITNDIELVAKKPKNEEKK